MTSKFLLLAVVGFCLSGVTWGQIPFVCERATPDDRPRPLTPLEQTSRGPTDGPLLVVGGNARNREIYDRFLQLGGGPESKVVLVPTNSGGQYQTPQQIENAITGFRDLTGWQMNQVTLVHTYDPRVANTTEFIQPILEANIAWFGGGRQWRMADSYLNTLAEEAFRDLLKRGGVIGGSSAGASIMGDVLVRGDTATANIIIGDHLQGLAYVTNIGFDQHFLPRNRQDDMIEFVRFFPNVLGISIDEDTGIVMEGDVFEVIGSSFVAITDRTIWPDVDYCSNGLSYMGRPLLANGGKRFFLQPGDRYNVRTREVVSMKERFDENKQFF